MAPSCCIEKEKALPSFDTVPKPAVTGAGSAAGSASGRDLVGNLRMDIVNGFFAPGARLKFAALAKRYDAGHGTLREALAQLTSEGFATVEQNKGFAVAPISGAELMEITEHYIDLEKRALANAIANGDDAWEGDIVSAHHKLQTIEGQPWEQRVALHSEWVIRHRKFHETLVAACQGPWLLRLRTMMFDQLDRYRFLTKLGPQKNGNSRSNEHRKIMEAVLARDADAAALLIDSHIRRTAEQAVKLI